MEIYIKSRHLYNYDCITKSIHACVCKKKNGLKGFRWTSTIMTINDAITSSRVIKSTRCHCRILNFFMVVT